ncbi:MAG: bifunctional (p)ppGpp synthetase/guanosine-3',5'-bis(diphosphate) 3'-pyrophosphohydrolase [Cytophagales bacterium]
MNNTEVIIDLEAERKEIISRYRKLLRSAKPFLKDGDAKLIKKAFYVSAEAHKDMRRKSGEPYIYHPIAVAQIAVEEIGLGTTSIVASLLHDVVEDTDITLQDIEKDFGPKVARIIDGLTKIENVSGNSTHIQAENFRKMLLSISDDVRVILIKLADRLHNMRTLGSMARDKQLKIASETIYLYAPLAHRLGLYVIKTELEDLYLKYSNPQTYRSIANKLQQTRAARNKFINDFIEPLDKELKKMKMKYQIYGRPKSIYSICNKLKKGNVNFEEIYDLFAIRVVVDAPLDQEKSSCWQIYSIVTDYYKPNPDRLKDWISTPKSNGYESLHTTVMSSTGQWVEVQIRTKRMDDIAEKGYAAHWKYKENTSGSAEKGLENWINKVRDTLKNADGNAMEFLDQFRTNLFLEEVFVFTPKGDLKTLPKGATILDFAFEIHTKVGLTCMGGKVNQKLVPLSYVVKNGDQIEIITSAKQRPSEDWLKFVTTSKARAKIKDSLKEEVKILASDGKEILERKLKALKVEYNSELVNQLLLAFNEKSATEFYYKIAKGTIESKDIKKALEPEVETKQNLVKIVDKKTFEKELTREKGSNSDTLVIGERLTNIDYTFAKCCNPIQGDEVFGFVTINEGIKIHRTTCPNAVELMSNYGYRIIKATWDGQKEQSFLANLKINGTDRMGIASQITKIISNDHKVNIRSITLDTKDGIFEGQMQLHVHNTDQLEKMIKKLSAVNGVNKVYRNDTIL